MISKRDDGSIQPQKPYLHAFLDEGDSVLTLLRKGEITFCRQLYLCLHALRNMFCGTFTDTLVCTILPSFLTNSAPYSSKKLGYIPSSTFCIALRPVLVDPLFYF